VYIPFFEFTSDLYPELDNPVAIGFFVNFGEISYLAINKKNKNDQEPGLILTGNGIKKCVIDKNVSLK
jgi:hypothetical protein